MSKVLFATDFSQAAGVAERLIGSIPWPSETSIRVVTVVPRVPELMGTPWMAVAPVNADDVESTQVTWAETNARDVTARLAGHGLDVSWVVLRGQPADAIVDVARSEAVDLVVLGSRGRGALEGALLGSVSEAVADRAPCPVLIARRSELHRSLIADDASPGAQDAIAYVRRHRHLLGNTTRLLAVQQVADAWIESFETPVNAGALQVIADGRAEVWQAERGALESDAVSLRNAGQNTDVAFEEGRPAGQIEDAALRWRADLVVVGSRHRTGVTRLVMGSVGRHVLHHSPCSVLLVGHVPAAPPASAVAVKPAVIA